MTKHCNCPACKYHELAEAKIKALPDDNARDFFRAIYDRMCNAEAAIMATTQMLMESLPEPNRRLDD